MFYVPTRSAECWKGLLADPQKHWRTGYSARTLAHCWEAAKGIPPEVSRLFAGRLTLLLAIPEHKVGLAGGGRPSQTDLFALMRMGDATISCAVEGKVDEPFGPTIGERLATPSTGKVERLRFLCRVLGLEQPLTTSIRYQLLHRTASAVIEAERFKTDEAALIVHSFSPSKAWFADFASFAALFGKDVEPDRLVTAALPSGRRLHLGWATGDTRFLRA